MTPGGEVAASPSIPLGDVIRTGERWPGGELALWFEPVDAMGLSGAYASVMAGFVTPDGQLLPAISSDESSGLEEASGFVSWFSIGLDGESGWLLHGYYAGPAQRITVVVDGQAVDARLQAWSENPGIVVFWLSGPAGPSSLGDLTAYDANGTVLAVGSTIPGI